MITQMLVADSDAFMLDRCRGYFLNRGFQVETATNGLQCIEALRRFPPDILVLDLELPWGGGDGVLACLHEDRFRWPSTVILATSEFVPEPPCGLDARVKAVLRKPFSMSTLFDGIRRAHHGETHLAARFLWQAQKVRVPEQPSSEWRLGYGPTVSRRHPRNS